MWNFLFTAMPIIFYSILEQDLPAELILQYPRICFSHYFTLPPSLSFRVLSSLSPFLFSSLFLLSFFRLSLVSDLFFQKNFTWRDKRITRSTRENF